MNPNSPTGIRARTIQRPSSGPCSLPAPWRPSRSAAAGRATSPLTAAAAGAPATIPQPTDAQLAASGLAKLPVAPESERVDIAAPTFSNPTEVTNPLFPITELHSAILNGRVEGKPFHTETTLLPETRMIEWAPGQTVETLVSQYSAFLDGRIEEVALDYYAQADDGSVWYFGEDVFNYNEDGVIADTDGTWLAGKEGPPAMIMPADPRVGDVHRPENIPGLVFEEVAVKTIDKTVDGPQGPTEGALVGRELHDDGTYSDKVFAPGYGEFYSAHAGDVEALALAVPTDALAGPPSPEELRPCRARRARGVRRGARGDGSRPRRRTGSWRRLEGLPRRRGAAAAGCAMTRALMRSRPGRRPRPRAGRHGRDRRRPGDRRPRAAPPAPGRDRPGPVRALGAPDPRRRRRRRHGGRHGRRRHPGVGPGPLRHTLEPVDLTRITSTC